MNSIPVKAINLSKEMGIDVLYDNYEYKLLATVNTQDRTENLSDLVNKHLKDGWKLYGDLGISLNGGSDQLTALFKYQAVIRKLPAKGGNRTRRNR
jgi:hypothetical protein